MKKLKQILEISGAKKNDENIKNKDLLEFNTALNYKEIENLLFDINIDNIASKLSDYGK